MMHPISLLALVGLCNAAAIEQRSASVGPGSVPADPFQTTPQSYAGPTPTGQAPFLAQTNPAPFSSKSFVANDPLETAIPVSGADNENIFQLMGQLSSYFPNPDGFGVDEYSLPEGANISQVHVLHRHGARYPTGTSDVSDFGEKIGNLTRNGTEFSGPLSFLNSFEYKLGAEILVPRGRQEMFDSGVLHYYQYGALYDPNTKIIARSTTQDRMTKSAEYFLAGFFGQQWTRNASLELIIEEDGFNISLAGYKNCNNSNLPVSTGGTNASEAWQSIYLQDATARLKDAAGGYNWTVSDTYNLQTLCAYETVAYGYSEFCSLFTYEEWQGFEYTRDLSFYGNNAFGSPTGRAVGIGFVEEILARLENHVLDLPDGATQDNTTLDGSEVTFPLGQTLYFDFSHDTNIAAILTAFGLTQFAQFLPDTGPPTDQQGIVSHMEPFAARLDIEVITTPQPVAARRSDVEATYVDGGKTRYVHFALNQRTVPLGRSMEKCGDRDDGWCEFSAFMETQQESLQKAQYEYACFGDYPNAKWGDITDGVPVQ